MTFIGDGGTVVGGITGMAAFGHSPGHMIYRLESEGRQLVLTADTANHYVLSLQRPDWEVRFDMDKAAAAAALALTSKLAVFEAEHDRFLVTVFIQTINIGPSKAVVDETQALATALAAAVKKKNAPALALKALTKYLGGAIAVFNGKVPVPPAAPAPAPAPAQG